MLDNEVIILAQGPMDRMSRHWGRSGVSAAVPELQPLPACGMIPVIMRTMKQAARLGADRPALITWDRVNASITGNARWTQLPEPGNSALKGIARYLEIREQQGRRYERTIVLLGDVVYSWACLEAIWGVSKTFGFVGTKDLSMEAGELWGVAWSRGSEDRMIAGLRDALLRHPLGDEYHPAQLRRWVTGWQRGRLEDHVGKLRRTGAYIDVDDYTHDIDVPMNLVMLPDLSWAAAADDAEHGIRWRGGSEP